MAGSGAVLVTDTLGFSRTESNRLTDVSALEDEDAFLALENVGELGEAANDCGVVNEFTITNQLGEDATITLSSDEFDFEPHTFPLDETDSETVVVSVDEDESGEIEIEAITDPASIEATVTREAAIEDWSEPSGTEPDEADYDDILDDAEGNGTESDPYVITDDQELQAMAGDLDAHYELGRNIDASETDQWHGGDGFDPIGDEDPDEFEGVLDGNGYEICGLTIDRPGEEGVGLFSVNSGTITDLTLTHSTITGENVVGGTAGNNAGTIEEVDIVDPEITGDDGVGGVVGVNVGFPDPGVGGTIEMAAVPNGTVTGDDAVGGVVGLNDGDVATSFAGCAVTGENLVGGLAGANITTEENGDEIPGTITQSYAVGDVTGDEESAGGLVGINTGTITDTYARGDVVADEESVGGLVGTNVLGEDDPLICAIPILGPLICGLVELLVGLVSLLLFGPADPDREIVEDIEGEIYTSYAAVETAETGGDFRGGFAGVNEISGLLISDLLGTIEGSYWDEELLEPPGPGIGEGDAGDVDLTALTTDDMQGADAETEMDALDFDDVWRTVEDPDDYPELQWQDV
ncbi:GLUG domain protein [Natrialba magadii ATCC 43099]|uniref:GLUG domain protein n=1 Tax=Natrialba magadii (strain ATCC 43099 / DSM 3394 / CCM 3739 / CIP 104546 / IAM 13178 / JCM 8861 / NBRC 102185 / NCIMB 2190 / MS3) TaxID=547559 RepID=D3ST56_NATMM|nr:GLUG motif-containing protein [Natrialba magadii]ADD06923.1 GLUG domain protein [Natrialba magadii ATCC 43099]ELY28453.1 GLUG domain-containing protein [Natrialba magadii ATCC 43099]